VIKLSNQGLAYFASDLHLCQETPKTLSTFTDWISSIAQENTLIFLLGDVFEVWFGDDYTDPIVESFASATRKAHACGSTVYMMHGNRDFLMAQQFAQYAHIELLNDPEHLQVGQHTVLLTHGDQLCTDDSAYQQFRQMSRTAAWQHQFLSMSLEQRIALATKMRTESKMHKANTNTDIMDVNKQAVDKAFLGQWPDGQTQPPCQVIIHGHTHRCAIHTERNSTSAKSQQGVLTHGLRIVLPDWSDKTDHAPDDHTCRGGFLTLKGNESYDLQVWP
jgi:UDP-2,3-diacylglucosamine hydrolase